MGAFGRFEAVFRDGDLGHLLEQLGVVDPAVERVFDAHPVFGHRLPHFEWFHVHFDNTLREIVVVHFEDVVDLVAVGLPVAVVVYVVVDGLEQVNELLGFLGCPVQHSQGVGGAEVLSCRRRFKRRIRVVHIRKSSQRLVGNEIGEKLDKANRIIRHGDVLFEFLSTFKIDPALFFEFANEEACAALCVAEFFRGRFLVGKVHCDKLLLQAVAEHVRVRFAGDFQSALESAVQHKQGVAVHGPVGGG